MKISVVIITKERKEDLEKTLLAFQNQTYQDKEIILIDNASKDGTREMMKNDFPTIKYLWLPDDYDLRSINIGVEMATGDVIWRCDDDSFPESNDAFNQVIDIFTKHNDIDIIATEDIEVKKGNTAYNWYPLKVDKQYVPQTGYKSHTFHGTGAAIRKRVFDKIGGFWEYSFEELDFSSRALLSGFNIRYFPNIRTLHFSSDNNRFVSNRWIKTSKLFVRYIWKYYPLTKAIFYSIFIYFFQIMMAILQKVSFGAILEGMLTIPATAISTIRNERIAVTNEQYKEITLGVSLLKTQFNYFKQGTLNKLRNLFSK